MKVLILVARRYNGHELWVSLGILQDRGHTFDIASTKYAIEDEVTGQKNIIRMIINEIGDTSSYDALMIISGNMADTEAYWTDYKVQQIVTDFHTRGVPIAAICCSVPTVRKATTGRKVSFFPLIRSRHLLEDAGAILCSTSVSVDGNLVTAEHQMATQMWVESFCDVLEGKAPQIKLKETGFDPGRREGKPIPALEHLKEVTKQTGRSRISGNKLPSK